MKSAELHNALRFSLLSFRQLNNKVIALNRNNATKNRTPKRLLAQFDYCAFECLLHRHNKSILGQNLQTLQSHHPEIPQS